MFHRRCLALLTAVACLSPGLMAHDGFSLRINCGGNAYTDSADNDWVADQMFTNGVGVFTANPIANTPDPTLYQTARRGFPIFYDVPVPNGDYEVVLHFAEIEWTQTGERLFDVRAENVTLLANTDIIVLAGADFTAVQETINTTVLDGELNLVFQAVVDRPLIAGIEILAAGRRRSFPSCCDRREELHATDYDNDDLALISLDGRGSHTHEIGHDLTNFTWSIGAQVVGTDQTLDIDLEPGTHTVTLTIEDDNAPARQLSDSVNVSVYRPQAVGGALTYYSVRADPQSGPQVGLIHEYAEVLENMSIEANGNEIGTTGLTENVRVQMEASIHVQKYLSYEFKVEGGTRGRIRVDGNLANGPMMMYPGFHRLEADFLIQDVADLPAQVLMSIEGAPFSLIPSQLLSHDQQDLRPHLNPFNNVGSSFGGNTIELEGIGFFRDDEVMVHWGNDTFMAPTLTVTPEKITFVSPPGSGTIPVSVETPNGISNLRTFTYNADVAPVIFNTQVLIAQDDPTQGAFGPDGRLYVASLDGNIYAYTLDENYNITATQHITAMTALSNHEIIGLAFSPFDPPSPVRLYVSHAELFANGGDCFVGTSDYNGGVSYLDGPNFDTVVPIVTGLPVSNHDHSINGLDFDMEGNLLLSVGSQTNAGVPACPSGGLPESPLSASILKFPIYEPGFNGTIEYVETVGGLPNNDQVFGDIVDVVDGVDAEIYLTGLRNTFELCLTTKGIFYGADNGPNEGFGAASTSATTETDDPWEADEILALLPGHYYGHPNRNRGRTDARQNVYHAPTDSHEPGSYRGPIHTENASINGMAQYRAMTFGGDMYNDLIYQKWNAKFYRGTLSADGLSMLNTSSIATGPSGLDVIHGPGGVVVGLDYSDDDITISTPIDAAAVGLTGYDIFPWRALPNGAVPFVIGGANFGSLADMKVTIGTEEAVLTSATSKRLEGFIPASAKSNCRVAGCRDREHQFVRHFHSSGSIPVHSSARHGIRQLEGGSGCADRYW